MIHPHPHLQKGDPCPNQGCDGKIYPLRNPGIFVRVTADEPVKTTVHLVEKLRCNLCGEIFSIIPEHVKEKPKYDEKLLAHIALNKCFFGVSYTRSTVFGDLAPSVLTELFKEADRLLMPVFNTLAKTLINESVISFDDTKIKIQPESKGGKRSAWASCFVSEQVILYLFSEDHAGICFEDLLKQRIKELSKPVVLTDALPSYEPYKKDVIDAHCLTHARRRFKDAYEEDSDFCDEMIDLIGEVYDNDSETKEMAARQRLEHHKSHSTEVFEQIVEEVEEARKTQRFLPSSELSKAIDYIIEKKDKLKVFLEVEGVPLDTNHVERKIKSIIRIRKQAPIFKTKEGAARTGRLLSLIETALHVGVNPRKYLEWAVRKAREGHPVEDMTPWVFKRHLEQEGQLEVRSFEKEGPKAQRPEYEEEMATS